MQVVSFIITDRLDCGDEVKRTSVMRRILHKMCTKHQAPEPTTGHGVLKPYEHFDPQDKTRKDIEQIIKEEVENPVN